MLIKFNYLKFNYLKFFSQLKKHQLHHYNWNLFTQLFFLQCAALYGLWLVPSAKWQTLVLAYVFVYLALLGNNAGAHRYWTHRTFKAKLPLRIFLMFCHTVTMHRSLRTWCRDHKIHHKYSDTAGDPHNAKRGFFFSHMGWIFMPKSREVLKAEKEVDLSDLESDPIIMFQHKYYELLAFLFAVALPVSIAMFFWNESMAHAFFIAVELKTFISSHINWCNNSVCHMFGYKPYDKTIGATQNITIAFLLLGEGWHNYHHAFAWDYKGEEFGGLSQYFLNNTTAFIDLCAKLGLAYDLKQASFDVIEKRRKVKGDKSELM